MNTTTIGDMIQTSIIQPVGDVLTNNLPAVLLITGSLIGLVLIVKYARKLIK